MKSFTLSALYGILILISNMTYADVRHDFRERVHVSVSDSNSLESDTIAEIEFGREVAAKILGNNALLRDENITRYISLVGNRVARNSSRPELTWHFAVLDTDAINAYAAPGGYIFVTKGALAKMDDEAELAAVLSHEVAHVTGRHIVKALNIHGTDKSATASMARLVGSVNESTRTAFNQVVDGAVQILFEKGLGHSDEFEADRNGIIALTISGYDPMALTRYLERIQGAKPESTTILTKTHPAITQRLNLLRSLASEEKLVALGGKTAKSRFNNNIKF